MMDRNQSVRLLHALPTVQVGKIRGKIPQQIDLFRPTPANPATSIYGMIYNETGCQLKFLPCHPALSIRHYQSGSSFRIKWSDCLHYVDVLYPAATAHTAHLCTCKVYIQRMHDMTVRYIDCTYSVLKYRTE